MRKEITLCGCWGYNTFGEEAYLRHMLAQGILPLAPLITHEISLDEAPAMIRAMADRSLHYGKVMIGL
jgi:threonine dehydrogenase-like Zn-dependent dehydrogenase